MEYSEENAVSYNFDCSLDEESNILIQYDRPSGIRPPMARIPSPGKGLQEISQSENNTRAKPLSRMPAPTNIKRVLGYRRCIWFEIENIALISMLQTMANLNPSNAKLW
jgi:hypothetical protein